MIFAVLSILAFAVGLTVYPSIIVTGVGLITLAWCIAVVSSGNPFDQPESH